MGMEERREAGLAGPFDLFQCWPTADEVAEEDGVPVFELRISRIVTGHFTRS
jgi:hypothetical protein